MSRIAWGMVLFCVAAWGQTPAPPRAVADPPANRLEAARRYLKAVPPLELVKETVDQLAQKVPEDRREEFRKVLAQMVHSEHIEKITLDAIVKHFTVKEINALAAFYGSPEGRSISKKFNAYMADVMPAIQQELAGAMTGAHQHD
jgi:hypothetical protein